MPTRLHHRVLAAFRSFFHRRAVENELDDELRFHLEQMEAHEVARGSDPARAHLEAERRFGAFDLVKEACRDMRTLQPLEEFLRDVGFGGRLLARSPVFAVVAILSLALAIGATTVMFSVLNAVLLRPLPYRSPEQLAMLWTVNRGQDVQRRPSYVTVEDWRRLTTSFADMAVLDPVSVTLTEADGAERISVARISPNFFPLLGIQPLQGRHFSDDEAADRQHVALISHRFWQSRFAGSPAALGTSIVLNGLPSRIIGVLPASLEVPFYADVWEPHTMFPDWDTRRANRAEGSWFVVGRLRPDVTLDQAQAEMSAIAPVLDNQLPTADRNRGISVVPLSVYVVGPRSRLALWMLAGAVLCVLLIAAANVSSLSLARSVGRAREIAIRVTLGASTPRIVRQLLAEGMTLAAIACLAGAAVAVAGIGLIRAVGPADLARLNEVSLDLPALGWTLAVSLVTGVLVGLAPALSTLQRNPRLPSQEGGRSVAGGFRARGIRRALVAGEFALAIVLMAGAGLLMRSWWNLVSVDPGFSAGRILSLQLSATALDGSARRLSFYERVLEQIGSLPGIESVGIIGDLFVGGDSERVVTTEGNGRITSERVRLRVDEASAGLFGTVGTPLIRGRFFSIQDGPDAPRVAIVNEAMARRVWPGRDPVGVRFKFGPRDSGNPWVTVVGVVGDMRRQGLETEPIPQVFEPLAQNPSGLETLLVRTSSGDPLTMVPAIRAEIGRLEKRAPVYSVTTVDDRIGADLAQRNFQTSLLMGFSFVALLMAAIGIYGLIHYSVATRTHEIGIRMAIGARAGDIFRMIVREGLQLSVTGLVIGLLGALWVGQAVSTLLFGVTATDPLTLGTVCLLLTAVAGAACYFPARRAMKVSPVVALRQA